MFLKRCISALTALAICASLPFSNFLSGTVHAESAEQPKGSYTDAPQPGQIHIYAGSTSDIVDDWGIKIQSIIPQEKYLNQAKSAGSLARVFNYAGYGRSPEQLEYGISAEGNGWHRKMTQRIAYKDAQFVYDIPVDPSTPAPLYISMETMGELKVFVNDNLKIDTGAVGFDGYGITSREIRLDDPSDWASGKVSVTFADGGPDTGSDKGWLDAEQQQPDPEFGLGAHLIWMELGPSSTFRDRAKHILWDTKDMVWNVGYFDGRNTEFKGADTLIDNAKLSKPESISKDSSEPYEIKWDMDKNGAAKYYLLAGIINGEKHDLTVSVNGGTELKAPSSETKGLGPTTERVQDLDVTSMVKQGANTMQLTLPQTGSLDFLSLVEVVDGTITKDQLKMSFGGNEQADNWTKLVNSTMYFHNDMMTDKSTGYIVASLPNGLFPQLYFLADAAPAMLEIARWGYAEEAKQATLFREASNHNNGDNGAAGIVYSTIAYLMKGDNYQGDYVSRAWPLMKAGLDGLAASIDSELKLIKGNNIETTSKEYSIYNNSINAFAFLAGAEAADKLGHSAEAAAWKTAAETIAQGMEQNLITDSDTAVGSYTIGKDTWKYGINSSKETFGGVNAGWFGVGSQEELYYGYKGYSENPATSAQETQLLEKWRTITENTLDYHSNNFWADWNLYGHNRGFGTSYGVLSERGGWPTTSMLMSDEMAMFTKNLNHIIWNSSDDNFSHGNMGVQETSPWLLIREANRSDHGIAQLSEIGNGGYNEDMNSVEYIVALRNARIMAGLDDSLEGTGNVNIIPRLPLGFNSVSVNGWQANYKNGADTKRTNISYDYNVSALEAGITASAEHSISGSCFRFGPFDVRTQLDNVMLNGADATASATEEVRGDSKWVWVDANIGTTPTTINVKMKLDDLSVSGESSAATKLFDAASTAEFDIYSDVKLENGKAGIEFYADETASPAQGYRYILDKNAGDEGQLRIEKADGTVLHKLDMNVNTGRTYRLRLAMKDSTMMAFLDGVKVMQVVDASYAGGKQGVYVDGQASHSNITCVNNADTITVSPLKSASISYVGGYQNKEVPYMFMGQSKNFNVMATFENGEKLDVTGMGIVDYEFTDPSILEDSGNGKLTAVKTGSTKVKAVVTIGAVRVESAQTTDITVQDFDTLYIYTPKPNEEKYLETVIGRTSNLTLWTKYQNGGWWILDDEMPELDISFEVSPSEVASVNYDFSRDIKSRTQITGNAEGQASVRATVTIDGKTVTSPAAGDSEDFTVDVINPAGYPNFIEDFEDGNSDGWNGASPAWSVSNGRYKVVAEFDSWSISTAKGANFAYSADVELEKGSAVGLTFRSDEYGKNSYDLMLDKSEGLKLNRRTNGGYANVEKVAYSFNYKQPYRLKAVVEGGTLKAYVNGELKLTYDNLNEYNLGNFGLIAFSGTAYYDNIKAYTQNQVEYIEFGSVPQPKLSIEKGSSETLSIKAKNADETDADITGIAFTSTNPNVATADATGKITAHETGETTIKAAIDLGEGKVVYSNSVEVVVFSEDQDEKLGTVSLSSGGIDNVDKGDTIDVNLEATLEDGETPCNLDNAIVEWIIAPEGIVSEKSSGNKAITLQGDNPGQVNVSAKVTFNGTTKTTEPITLTVNEGAGFTVNFDSDEDAQNFTRSGPDVWKVEDGVMKISGGSGDYWNVYKESGGDFEFSADVTMTSGNSAGLSFRKGDEAHSGYDLIFSFFDGLKLARRPYSVLATRGDIKPVVGTTYNLKVVAKGDSFTIYVDGEQVMTAQDSTYSSGYFAFFGFDNTVASFDNMIAQPLDTTPPTWGSASLTADNIQKTSLSLSWSAASDKSGIEKYIIYQDGVELASVNAPATTYDVSGLESGKEYTYKVEAADTLGNTSTNGPSATVSTLADVVMYNVAVTAGEGGTAQGNADVESGNQHTVTAVPAEGYEFVNWTKDGEALSTSASYTFAVTQNISLVANFKRKTASSEIPVTSSEPPKSSSVSPSVSSSTSSSSQNGDVAVTSVALNMASKDMKVKQSLTLKAVVTPANATQKKVVWKSSNTKVATVTQTGKVVAVKEGTAKITASAGGKTASVNIRVNGKLVPVSRLQLKTSKLVMNAKGSYSMAATISPKNASNKKITWKSSNPSVASVDSKGKITAKAAGKATITATSYEGGKTAKCTVTVRPAVSKLTLSKKNATILKGKSITLKAAYQPKEADAAITWTSSKPDVATVSSKGVVKSVAKGTTVITASAGNRKATCKITVK